MSESNESRKEDDKKNEGKKRIRFKILKNAKKQENDVKNINDKTKRMQILRRIVCQKEYNELKSINNNSRDTSASSDISIDSSNIERDQIGSNTNNAVAFKSSSGFKNKLVRSLYKKFGRQCSIEKALEFFRLDQASASDFDDNFWDEILYVINLSNCTIKQLVEFKQNVVILANEKVSWLGNWLGPKMAPEKIKFAISPDMFQGLVYNSNPEKSFIDYLGDKKYQKRLDSFRVVLDGPNDDIKRESCGKLLDFILKDLEDDCQPVKDMIVLLQICRVLLCQKTIPVNVDGWKKIFSKINSLSIKDFLEMHSLVDYPEVNLDDLEKFLFSKLNSKDDTQETVQEFINMFFSGHNDKIKSDREYRLHVFKLFIGCFPDQKLDFSFVTNCAEQNFNLGLSSLDIKDLVKVISKVKSNSIDLKNFNSIVKVIGNKKFSVNKEEDVDKLRQLLCDVLRISGKELGFSDIMDLFLLYSKMPELCSKSTLTNESLKLALKNTGAKNSNNKNLSENKDEFRSKFKNFIKLFKDGANKITFDNFKNLISSVTDGFLDFDCINCLLEKTDTNKHQDDVFSFFEDTLLTKKIDESAVTWEKVHEFLSNHEFYSRTLQTNTFKYIINVFIKSKTGKTVSILVDKEGKKDEFREQFKSFVSSFVSSLKNNKITFDNFKNLILSVPDNCLDFDCIDDLLKKTDVKEHQDDLYKFFENTLLKKISQYKFDLKQVHDFFEQYLSGKSDKDFKLKKLKAKTLKFIVDVIIDSNQDCSCSNEDIEWLLQKCCDAGAKLENGQFVSLIKKGKTGKIFDGVAKIDWMKMNDFINKIVSPKSGFLDKGKIEFDKNELNCILSRTKFCFDKSNLGDFLKKILTLKQFVTGDELFKIILHRIPRNGLSDLNMFRTIVYYCFENIQKYDSDWRIEQNYSHKIDSGLYEELLETFEDESLSFEDFQKLDRCYLGKNKNGTIFDFIFSFFLSNNDQNKITVAHKILKKKLKCVCLTNDQIKTLFQKIKDKKLSKDDFIEFLMLAENNVLTIDDFMDLLRNHCKDKIETENNDDMLTKIANKISNTDKETLRTHLREWNVEKGITQLLDDIEENFSVLFKLTDQRLKKYGLSTLLNQGDQENNRRNNRQENVANANPLDLPQLNQDINHPLLGQNNRENSLNSVIHDAQNAVVGVVESLDEGKYGFGVGLIKKNVFIYK